MSGFPYLDGVGKLVSMTLTIGRTQRGRGISIADTAWRLYKSVNYHDHKGRGILVRYLEGIFPITDGNYDEKEISFLGWLCSMGDYALEQESKCLEISRSFDRVPELANKLESLRDSPMNRARVARRINRYRKAVHKATRRDELPVLDARA